VDSHGVISFIRGIIHIRYSPGVSMPRVRKYAIKLGPDRYLIFRYDWTNNVASILEEVSRLKPYSGVIWITAL